MSKWMTVGRKKCNEPLTARLREKFEEPLPRNKIKLKMNRNKSLKYHSLTFSQKEQRRKNKHK